MEAISYERGSPVTNPQSAWRGYLGEDASRVDSSVPLMKQRAKKTLADTGAEKMGPELEDFLMNPHEWPLVVTLVNYIEGRREKNDI